MITSDQFKAITAKIRPLPIRRNASNDGTGFQNRVQTVLDAYERQGVMYAAKCSPPQRVVGTGANRKVIFLANPWPDFFGVWKQLAAGGIPSIPRPIAFEAKSTSTPELRIGSDGGLTAKQCASLKKWHDFGAITFVLWEYKGKVSVLPWRNFCSCATAVSWDDDGDCICPPGKGYVLFDFCEVLRRLF